VTGRWAAHSDKSDEPPETDVPAVAYVRMSTDHQKYSTENQLDIIRDYATARGLKILRVFEDSGRSGLRLDGREALQNLMAEVRTGQADFKAILVYDVSRWGRFQDADEGAYHEHVCSRAGIRVHYCGEQFENDGSIGSNLLKTVKRVMAGEYSRELSVKVFAGQCRLVELGYRQGGAAGYGLRRVLIDEHGNPKGALSRGQQKSFQTDRVVLVPGPEQEQDVVRRMYRMFVEDDRSEREIAETLNAEGHLTDLERPWSRASVHQVLTNEKYIGNNVYNKVSFKLKHKRVVNPPALLKGLIFSETGAAMTPTSTKKGAKLYRYYVSMDVIRNRETGEETAPMRLAAGMVEDAVVTEVRRILQTPEVVTQVIAALKTENGAVSEADAIAALHEFSTLWAQLFPAEQAWIIQLLIRRVTVTAAGLEVDIRREGIAGVIREMVAPRKLEAAE
jgi:DNA invertase Pin-like site-specific DNA recombinase